MEIRRNIESNNVTTFFNNVEKPIHVKIQKKSTEEVVFIKKETELAKKCDDDKRPTFYTNECLLWGMHLKRRAVIENMSESIEHFVKECLHWKQQLEALIDSNRILRKEKRTLTHEYQKLLEKTKHDDGIINKLKNSENKLLQEKAESMRLNQRLQTSLSVKDVLFEDKIALEKERNALIKSLETHNRKLKRINHDRELLQKKIEKRCEELENRSRNREEMSRGVGDAILRLEKFFEMYKEIYFHRDGIVESIQTIQSKGLRSILMPTSEISENSKTWVSQSEKSESVKETSDDQYSSADEDLSEMENLTTSVKSDALKENKIDDQNSPNKPETNDCALQISKEKNQFLLEMYSFLNSKLEEWSNKQLQLRKLCSDAQSTNEKLADKSIELEKLVHVTRRNFKMPQRNPELELKMRVQEQKNENEALSDLLTECLSFKDQNNQMIASFRENILKIYKSHLYSSNATTEPSKSDETTESPKSEETTKTKV